MWHGAWTGSFQPIPVTETLNSSETDGYPPAGVKNII